MSEPKRDPKTGTWFFVTDVGRDGGGRRRQAFRRGFPTKKAAQQAMAKIRVDVGNQRFVPPANQTVADYLRWWLAGRRLRKSTLEGYGRNIEHYIIPRIGGVQLDKLTAAHLDAMYKELLESGRRQRVGGLAPRTVRYVHTVVHKALKDAVRKGTLAVNVSDLADPPTTKEAKAPEMQWWKPEELKRFLAFTGDEDYGPLFRLAGMTGMRRGELCGLQWRQVDFERATVRVLRQLLVDGNHDLYFQEIPKTDAGRRTIDIDEETVAVLRSQWARQAAHRLAVGPAYRDDDLVFALPDGSPIDPESMVHVFDRRLAKSHLPRIRFHDLRHSHAAHLIAAKEDVLLISKRLGHSSVAFTLDRYGHLFDTAGSQAAAKVAALVDGATS